MKEVVISVDKLHEMQFDDDYTEYIRGWNDAIDQILTDGSKIERNEHAETET